MSFINDFSYTPNYSTGVQICDVADGQHICSIISAKPMQMQSNGFGAGLRYMSIMLNVADSNGVPYELRIKEGDKFDAQFSRFLDAFNVVRDLNQMAKWTGAKANCNFWKSENNGKSYLNCMPLPEKKSDPTTPIF